MTPPNLLTAAILIISDTAARDPTADKTTPILTDVFDTDGGGRWRVTNTRIVSDSIYEIQDAVTTWTDAETPVNLIVTSGGTGFAVKDNTPEAVGGILHKHAPGLVHGMLATSLSVTQFAIMSRPVAGVRHKTLILTLPGSPKGAKENLQSVLKLLPHACTQAAGADSRELHKGGVKGLEKEAGLASGSSSQSHHHNHIHGHNHDHDTHKGPVRHTDQNSHPKSNNPYDGPTRRHRSSPYEMLSVSDALQSIAANVPAPRIIEAPVNQSLVGCVVAEDVKAAESVPAFRASIVDGYAIVVSPEAPSIKSTFPVAFVSHAQAADIPKLKAGNIARITTGAPLPPGATAVVMVEDTTLKSMTDDGSEEKEVEILTDAVKSGENVREVGSDVQAGNVVLKKGEGVSAGGGEFGLLASVGVLQVPVYRKPVVGVLSTGDEIVQHDRPGALRLGEVRDTNRPTLLTVVKSAGFEAFDLGIASDKPGDLEATLRSAFQSVDLLITSGGVSMGELDLLKPTLERTLGGTIHFGRVSMKPGKPTTFATVPHLKDTTTGSRDGSSNTKVVFSLPGNPASAVVTFFLFVLPALHRMSGISPAGLPKVQVTLEGPVKCDPARAEYHRVVVVAKRNGKLYASSTGMQRSSRIGSFKGANALLCLPAEKRTVEKGEQMEALLMGGIVSEL